MHTALLKRRAANPLTVNLSRHLSLQSTLEGVGTFSRASSGDYVGSGNVSQTATTDTPRFGYGDYPNAIPGLLLEGAATNLLTNAEALGTGWTASNVTVTTDDATGPKGGATAERLTSGAANGTLLQTYTGSSVQRTFSVWLKRRSGTGSIQITGDGGLTWKTVYLDSNWRRYDVTATALNPAVGIRIVTSGDSIWVTMAQLETGPFRTSYTTGTRAADSYTLPASSLNLAKGTISLWVYSTWDGADGVTHRFLDSRNGSSNQGFVLEKNSGGNLYFYVFGASGNYRIGVTVNANIWPPNCWKHILISYDNTATTPTATIYLDGVTYTQANTNSSYTAITVQNTVNVGQSNTGTVALNGLIRNIRFYSQPSSVTVGASIYAQEWTIRYFLVDTISALSTRMSNSRPGDTILVAPGTYVTTSITFDSRSGDAGRYLTLKAFDLTNRPSFVGAGASNGLLFTGCSYLWLEGLDISSTGQNGLSMDDNNHVLGTARFNVIKNCRVTGTLPGNYDGMKLSGVQDTLVIDNEISGWGYGGSAFDCVGCERVTFVNNYIHDHETSGADDSSGFQAKAGSHHIIWRNNRIVGCHHGINVGGESTISGFRPSWQGWENQYSIAEGNQFENCYVSVFIWGAQYCAVRYNTIYRSGDSPFASDSSQQNLGLDPVMTILNAGYNTISRNLIYWQSGDHAWTSEHHLPHSAYVDLNTYTWDSNAWYNASGSSVPRGTEVGTDAHLVTGVNPLLVNAAGGDFTVGALALAGYGRYALP